MTDGQIDQPSGVVMRDAVGAPDIAQEPALVRFGDRLWIAGDPHVGVAPYGRPPCFSHHGDAVARAGAAPRDVTSAPHLVGVLLLDVGKDRLERHEVAVDVRNHSYTQMAPRTPLRFSVWQR